eukprot:6204300-Pleurochrysis_carterae.AAC.1
MSCPLCLRLQAESFSACVSPSRSPHPPSCPLSAYAACPRPLPRPRPSPFAHPHASTRLAAFSV